MSSQNDQSRPSGISEKSSSETARALAGETCDVSSSDLRSPSGSSAAALSHTIRDYRLLELLGQGGMGSVYRAIHTRLEKHVALKLLPRDAVANEPLRARFEREMKAVGRLHHPHIVAAFDAGEADGVPYLVMELVDGLDVDRIARLHRRLPVPDACEIIRQAALGLQHIFEHGLVHRDIKPSNLIVARPRSSVGATVKILDLGLALLGAGELTQSGRIVGTLSYIAPEQADDPHKVDIRADLYSLGCTLHLLLAGAPPFGTDRYPSAASLLKAHATVVPAPLRATRADVPPELEAIVARLLEKSPGRRFPTPESLAVALAPLCRDSHLEDLFSDRLVPRPPSPSTDAQTTLLIRRPSTRKRVLLGLLALIVIIVGAAGAMQLLQRLGPWRSVAAAAGPKAPKTLTPKPSLPPKKGTAPATAVASAKGSKPSPKVASSPQRTIDLRPKSPQETVKQAVKPSVPAPAEDAAAKQAALAAAARKAEEARLEQLRRDAQEKQEAMARREVQRKALLALRSEEFDTGLFLAASQIEERSIEAARETLQALQTREYESVLNERQGEFDLLWTYVERTFVQPRTEMELVRVPAGEFLMGSPDSDTDGQADERPQHRVRITRPFLLGRYEVTRGQFAQFVAGKKYRTQPERDGRGGKGYNATSRRIEGPAARYTWQATGWQPYEDDHPVVNVTWNDAAAFCNWLSETEQLQPCYKIEGSLVTPVEGNGYRLPTEAEWEYACRAGTTTRFASGDSPESLVAVGNVADGSARQTFGEWPSTTASDGHVYTAPVGRFRANAFDLHDLHGNVWEWCGDAYDAEFYKSKRSGDDPQGPSREGLRVVRGGSWSFDPLHCRAANRLKAPPETRDLDLGFRVARTAK